MLHRSLFTLLLFTTLSMALAVSVRAAPVYLPLTIRFAAVAPNEPEPVCSCSANLYNCSDFAIQPQAQACYGYCIDQGAGDIHVLDADADGVACEALPPGFTVVR